MITDVNEFVRSWVKFTRGEVAEAPVLTGVTPDVLRAIHECVYWAPNHFPQLDVGDRVVITARHPEESCLNLSSAQYGAATQRRHVINRLNWSDTVMQRVCDMPLQHRICQVQQVTSVIRTGRVMTAYRSGLFTDAVRYVQLVLCLPPAIDIDIEEFNSKIWLSCCVHKLNKYSTFEHALEQFLGGFKQVSQVLDKWSK